MTSIFHRMLKPKKDEGNYARLGDRFFAAAIDMGVLYFAIIPLSILIFPIFYEDAELFARTAYKLIAENPELQNNYEALIITMFQTRPDVMAQLLKEFVGKIFIQVIMIGFYVIPMIKIKGYTVGKYVLGMKVTDSITGKNLSWAQSVIRYICYIPSVLPLFVGIFFAAFNKKKRCWHDFLSDTVVIYAEDRWYKKVFAWIRGEDLWKK